MKKFTEIISTILSVLLVIGALVFAIGAIGVIGDLMGFKMDSGREWSTINNFFDDILIFFTIIVAGMILSVLLGLRAGLKSIRRASKLKEQYGYATPKSKAYLIKGLINLAITAILIFKFFIQPRL
ncbi:MAG: hypothetical protein K2K91_00755 [Ruminococcus sp.]|nr:hypothetical protein [Ruminococcus sp.]MDE7098485.1 hypothetical protein [Ruminococcus sp.]